MSGLPWLEFELPCPPSKNRKMVRLGNNTPAVVKCGPHKPTWQLE